MTAEAAPARAPDPPLHSVPPPPRGCCICIDDAGRIFPVRFAAITARKCAGEWYLGARTFSPPIWAAYVSHVITVDGREHRLLPRGCITGQLSEELEDEIYSTDGLEQPPPWPRDEHRKRLREWKAHRAERRERARVGGNNLWKSTP